MKTIGIVGITIPGAADFLNKINSISHRVFKDHKNPKIVLIQQDFEAIYKAQQTNNWSKIADLLTPSLLFLCKNADFIVIPANTIHKVIHIIQERSSVPVLSMLDVVAGHCAARGYKRVGVMGTSWTMDHLYKPVFEKYGIEEVIPKKTSRDLIEKAIFENLIPLGTVSSKVGKELEGVLKEFEAMKCDSVLLACTELPLAFKNKPNQIPLLDTTELLALAAVEKAVEGSPRFFRNARDEIQAEAV